MTKEDLLYVLANEAKTPSRMSKKSHRIHTPIELVQVILNKIDPLYIRGDILVLYNIEFLMELATIGVDMTSVTFLSDDKFKTGAAKAMGVSVITELPMNKLFDVVIGNPPFQDADDNPLYYKIYNIAVSLLKSDGKLAFISPEAMALGLETGTIKGCHSVEQREIEHINISQEIKDKYFPKVGSSFCYFIVKNTPKTDSKYSITTPDGSSIISKMNPLQTTDNSAIATSIIDKCFTFKKNYYNTVWNTAGNAKKEANGTHKVVVQFDENNVMNTYNVTHTKNHKFVGMPKVFITGFGNRAMVCYDHDIVCAKEKNLVTVPTDSDEAGEKLVHLLESNLRKWFAGITTRGDRVAFIMHFNGVELDRFWTNEELYSHFGLTQEEVDYIEKNI